jgi:hypothetical protein
MATFSPRALVEALAQPPPRQGVTSAGGKELALLRGACTGSLASTPQRRKYFWGSARAAAPCNLRPLTPRALPRSRVPCPADLIADARKPPPKPPARSKKSTAGSTAASASPPGPPPKLADAAFLRDTGRALLLATASGSDDAAPAAAECVALLSVSQHGVSATLRQALAK